MEFYRSRVLSPAMEHAFKQFFALKDVWDTAARIRSLFPCQKAPWIHDPKMILTLSQICSNGFEKWHLHLHFS